MSSRWLRRAVVTLGLAAGALTLGAGVASANVLEDLAGITQDQSASNTNSTDQGADATAETQQYNVNVPIAILSPGANAGDVHQSNRADTDAAASNTNETDQWVGQGQSAGTSGGHGSCDPCSSVGGSIEQSQEGTNDNSTTQDANATAETKQVNVNVPIAILSPGANSGDVHQSNEADTDATATNGNSTTQSIDQGQHAVTSGGHGSWCGSCDGGTGSISQSQTGTNTNDTEQTADADATTEQWNVNAPISILSPGCGGCGSGGGVEQSNQADTDAAAMNGNATDQSIGQRQGAWVLGGSSCDHCGRSGGSVDQTQDASNDNSTSQDANAQAATEQTNLNAPFSFLSPGGSHGCDPCGGHGAGASQSNGARTGAVAGNANETGQSVEQDQHGFVAPAKSECRSHCEPESPCGRCAPQPTKGGDA